MKTYSIYITPAFPQIAAPVRHEFRANSPEHASLQARARHPNCTFGMPRDVTPPGYVVQFIDSVSGACLDRMPA